MVGVVGGVNPDAIAVDKRLAAHILHRFGGRGQAILPGRGGGRRQGRFRAGQLISCRCPIDCRLATHFGRCGKLVQRLLDDGVPAGLGEDVVFLDQVTGVGGDDAVADAEVDNALHQFWRFAVQPDFIQQVANGPRGPQAGDEGIAARLAKDVVLIHKGLRLAVHFTAQGDGGRATGAIAAGQGQLRAGKEVGQFRGVKLVHHNVAKIQADVGQDGGADLGVEAANRFVDGLPRPDVGRGAAVILGQAVQQQRVHVVAHAKGEEARAGGRGLLNGV